MKTLIVGGTGLSGAQSALHLHKLGHDVTLMSRNKPATRTLAGFSHIAASFVDDKPASWTLQGFDWLVFAAGADIRQLPADENPQDFSHRVNTVAIPRFFDKAREAGISRAVNIGTYYPQIVPEKIESDPYVRSRYLADEAIRAMSNDDFCVCSLNAPFIIGHVPGLHVPHLEALVHYIDGRFEGMPLFAPEGGVNHIASESLAEAVLGALQRGQCGKAYLVGDENLSWKAYLEMFCEALGKPQTLAVSADEHPMFPDMIMYAGRGATVSYEPENGELGYSRKRIAAVIKSVVEAYRKS